MLSIPRHSDTKEFTMPALTALTSDELHEALTDAVKNHDVDRVEAVKAEFDRRFTATGGTERQWFDNPRFDTNDDTDSHFARRARDARDARTAPTFRNGIDRPYLQGFNHGETLTAINDHIVADRHGRRYVVR